MGMGGYYVSVLKQLMQRQTKGNDKYLLRLGESCFAIMVANICFLTSYIKRKTKKKTEKRTEKSFAIMLVRAGDRRWQMSYILIKYYTTLPGDVIVIVDSGDDSSRVSLSDWDDAELDETLMRHIDREDICTYIFKIAFKVTYTSFPEEVASCMESLFAWGMIILGAGESIPADIPCKKC